MPRSMTGFGRATVELNGEIITTELSAVNHRYFDCAMRMPSPWNALEATLRESVKGSVARGKVFVSIRRDRGANGGQQVRYDVEVAKQYIAASRELGHLMSSTEALSLNTLTQLEGVFFQEEEEADLDLIKSALKTALQDALTQFNAARASEGKALAEDAAHRVSLMREALSAIEARLPELSKRYEERLRERVAGFAADTALTEERLAIEVALAADKTDVTEEVVRLKAHFDHVAALLDASEPIGRELNFLAQEIQREINTLGSKLRDMNVTREVLRMKSELEKLREQAQNIE